VYALQPLSLSHFDDAPMRRLEALAFWRGPRRSQKINAGGADIAEQSGRNRLAGPNAQTKI